MAVGITENYLSLLYSDQENVKQSLISKLFLLLFLVPVFVNAQENTIDSLTTALTKAPKDSTRVEILVELWRATAYNDPTKSIAYANRIISESKAQGFRVGIATGYQRLGISQSYLGLQDSALSNYHRALDVYNSDNSTGLQGVMLYNIGLLFLEKSLYDSAAYYIKEAGRRFEKSDNAIYKAAVFEGLGDIQLEKGNYQIAIQEHLKAATVYEKINDAERLGGIYIQIGTSYIILQSFEMALSYYKKATKLAQENQDLEMITNASIQTGITLHKMGQYSEAINMLSQSVTNIDSLGFPNLKAEALSSLGLVHFENENYDAALPFFQQSLAIAQEHKYQVYTTSNLINIGWIYFYRGKYDLATKFAKQGLNLALKTEIKQNSVSAYELLAKIFEKRGLFKEALTNYVQFKTINDSIYTTTKSAQIIELQTLYETEKKENEIAQQKEEIQLLNKQAQIDRLRMILLVGVLLAVVIISGLIAYGSRQKMKRTKAEREKEKLDYEKELAFKKKELTTNTLHLVQKNTLLDELKIKIESIKKNSTDNKRELGRIVQLIKNDAVAEKDWENFKTYFEQVHEDFDLKLREQFNDLTTNEMRLAALMKMNLTTKEMATILNISPDSVNKARYRLRKKLKLSADASLNDYILAL